jgi:excisionase family DNA binding protein
MGTHAPALYTVEEAAKLLRIGRTKAYALTQEWRATGGQSGLPVVDFGHVLRVPRAAVEKLLCVDLAGAAPPPARRAKTGPVHDAGTETATETAASPAAVAPTTKRRRPTNPDADASNQLDLFNVALTPGPCSPIPLTLSEPTDTTDKCPPAAT